MFVVLDKGSTKFYGFKCYLTQAKKHGITYCIGTAKSFRSVETATKFANKWFVKPSEYEIIDLKTVYKDSNL